MSIGADEFSPKVWVQVQYSVISIILVPVVAQEATVTAANRTYVFNLNTIRWLRVAFTSSSSL